MIIRIFYYFFFPIFLISQNVDMYLSLIHEGQHDAVKEKLPDLMTKYPNDPGVMYLRALLTKDGMKSLDMYNLILDKFPESYYASDASVKIGEYFYSRGLYTQACKQLCNVPRKYPRYGDMQRVIDLMVSSFQAVGQIDSARYYISIYQGMFPYLDIDKYGINTAVVKEPSYLLNELGKKEKFPYVIQIGAFSSIKNANRLKLQASQIGYQVEVVQLETNGRRLNAVRIVRYKSKTTAEKIGQLVKKKLGVDFRVLYRPING